MNIQKVAFFSIVSLVIWGAGCSAKIEPNSSASAPNDLGKITKTAYYLYSIEFPDGRVVHPQKGDMTIRFDTPNLISGTVSCNTFRASITWTLDVLSIQTYEKGARACERQDPLVFSTNMKYRQNFNHIELEELNGAWLAVFLKLPQTP